MASGKKRVIIAGRQHGKTRTMAQLRKEALAQIRAEKKAREKKPTDGLGPVELKKIRAALRQVWHRSHARNLVVKRCTREDNFRYCEQCGEKTPELKIDHIVAVGDADGMIERLFCPSSGLQGLCKECHRIKTKAERAALRESAGMHKLEENSQP